MATMTPLAWITVLVAAAVGSAAAAGAPAKEVMFGAAGPLLAAGATWWLIVRTWRAAPDALTGVLLKAFAGKAVFFGAYVVAVARGMTLSVPAFAVSFTVFFVGLYAVEALLLQRLLAGAR